MTGYTTIIEPDAYGGTGLDPTGASDGSDPWDGGTPIDPED